MKDTELKEVTVKGYIFGVEVGTERKMRSMETARLGIMVRNLEGLKGVQEPCDGEPWILLLFGTLNEAKIARNELWAMGFSCSREEIDPCTVNLAVQ